MFSSEQWRGEVFQKLCENRVVGGRLKQSLSDACCTRWQASRNNLFDMLKYRTLLSWNSTYWGLDVAKKKMEKEALQIWISQR